MTDHITLRRAAEQARVALDRLLYCEQSCNCFGRDAIAALDAAEKEQQMLRDGWRQCAKGQRTTQHCGLLDAAVKAEREACAKVCEEDGLLWGQRYAAAIRKRGEVKP